MPAGELGDLAKVIESLESAAVRQVDGLTGSDAVEDVRALVALAQRWGQRAQVRAVEKNEVAGSRATGGGHLVGQAGREQVRVRSRAQQASQTSGGPSVNVIRNDGQLEASSAEDVHLLAGEHLDPAGGIRQCIALGHENRGQDGFDVHGENLSCAGLFLPRVRG